MRAERRWVATGSGGEYNKVHTAAYTDSAHPSSRIRLAACMHERPHMQV